MKFVQTFPFKPHWAPGAGTNCVSVTPDGGFMYVGAKSVNFVKIAKDPLVKVFNTKQNIVAIDIDPCWNSEGKIFATLTSEKSILIWDFDKGIAISGHKAHCRMQSKAIEGSDKNNNAVHMGFLKNRNLLSLCSSDLVVYCVASNSICVRPKFAPGRGQIVTALKCSPYNENIFALGTNRGQVYICDIQKMAVLFTLGRFPTPVASLSWNFREITIIEAPKVEKTSKPRLTSNRAIDEEGDDIFNIYDYDYLENEFGAPLNIEQTQKTPIETNKTEILMNPNFDFQEACESLKQEINALKTADADENDEPSETNGVTLDDCRNSNNNNNNMACQSSENESTEGSLELVKRSTSSSDEDRHVDGREMEQEDQSISKHDDDHRAEEAEQTDVVEESENSNAKLEKKDEIKGDILLASASNDGLIWIWNAETGACCFNLKSSNSKSNKILSNVHIVWRSSTELYGIDAYGEIQRWTLISKNSTGSGQRRSYKLEKLPNGGTETKALAFGISKDFDNLWYISSKKEIICENIATTETIISFATATTNIMVACESPENNSKIAFGFVDRRIAFLETSQLSSSKIVIRHLQPKLNSFARALGWSANGLNIAYGTNEGQLGCINIDTQKHTTFFTIYEKPIYSIAWRGGEEIFMTCNDELAVYKLGNQEPLKIEGIKHPVSTVSIRKDYLFMGTAGGNIEIYRENPLLDPTARSFDLIQSVETAKHYITAIAWNPLNENQFAVVANEGCINLLSFNFIEANATLIRKIQIGMPKAIFSFVKWSNRDPNRFVTCGFDGALRVFDLSRESNEELIFVKYFHCPLYNAMLLPRDEQYALCTGKSITVEVVDTIRSDDVTQTTKSEGTLDFIKWATKLSIGGGCNAGNKKKSKSTDKKQVQQTENIITNANEIAEIISELTLESAHDRSHKTVTSEVHSSDSIYMKKAPTLMNLTTKEQNKNTWENINIILNSNLSHQSDEETLLIVKLFGTKSDAEKVLNAELEKVKTQTTLAALGDIFLSQVKGDLKDVILQAIQTRELNEWHVALSPTVSYSFWQKCSHAFAEQLIEQGYGLQAATYMLGLHRQRDAIHMLIVAKYFKEALLIARVHLLEGDHLLDDIISYWINDLERHGNLPGAALICTLSKQYMRGYEILSKQRVIGPEEARIVELLREKGIAS